MNLKQKRIEAGLSQEYVAKKATICRVHYTNIENGKRRPSPEVAKLIAKELGFDWTRFYESEVS